MKSVAINALVALSVALVPQAAFIPQSAASWSKPSLGVYAGPGEKGVKAAVEYTNLTGLQLTTLLDFPPDATWPDIEGPDWLLGAHENSPLRLEYSLPMFPKGDGYSLTACASGGYNSHWVTLGQNLMRHSLDDAIIRPGWEFNHSVYQWRAAGQESLFAKCFQQIVSTLRKTPNHHFSFDWNPVLGPGTFAAEKAYPGDDYVDYVGIDFYDIVGVHTADNLQALRDRTWSWIRYGNHGLSFWRDFSVAHNKKLAIPEWGLALLQSGKGGEDDPQFIERVFSFLLDPTSNLAYANYFNYDGGNERHALTGSTAFPNALKMQQIKAKTWATS